MTETEQLNNAIIAAIEERDRLRGERDHFRDCISAREVRKIVDERDALRALLREATCFVNSNLLKRIDAALKDKL